MSVLASIILLLPDSTVRLRQAETLPLRQATDKFERQIVLRVLERVRWNRSEAARILGIHRNSLKTMLTRWKLGGRGRRRLMSRRRFVLVV